ncbi:unnamed protein product [Fusarium venenatum]|uniref:WW domain-containing protein n=1 Tax=Fusarium venenatum TaxID=56646 RepID=A0A2L2TQY1_9HYPO|nr:uncharacterized protein FVRRES_03979 [Fusarium venenatum]CEI67467.1 unnamed protein product [Fusarium venenatum]
MEPLRHANTMPPQGLSHQRSVARKPVGKQSVVSSPSPQTFSLAHRPAPQQQQPQQYPAGGYPHNQQQQIQQQNVQQQRPQSYHPGQQVHPGYLQQSLHQIHNAQPAVQAAQSIPQQQHQGQHSQQPRPQLTQHQQPHPQSPQQVQLQQQSPAQQQQVQAQHQQPQQYAPPQHQVQVQHPQQQPHQQQSPVPQQQTHQSSLQQQIPGQYPQQQPFSPIGSAPNIASQTAQSTLANTHQTPPQPQVQPQPQPQPQTPAAGRPSLHHNDVASPTPAPLHHDSGHANASSFVPEHWIPASASSSSPNIAVPATTIASVASPSPIGTPTWDPTSPPPIQQTPTVDIRRTSTGQPKLCNHCRKGIPLNVSVYTCLICSTAHIATNFCVWCFTSNAVNTSHSHDKSYYATESDPRIQSSVQDATTHMWTIRKNVSGRLWYTHNATGLKTHLKPTAVALSGFSGLPPGWDERRTPDGRTFYFNKRLGTSAWTKPPNSLPEGWKELRTPDATPFYVNEQLGLSTWDRPGQQPKQGNKVVVRRRPAPGQPMTSQNVGDNILSATINAARLTGQGVESASRQVGKLGKKKNWRKLGRMLNQVNGLTGDNSGSDNECNDYNDNSGFDFGDDSGGYQDQQQGQFQQSFDQSFSEQSQQSFDFGDSQQQAMFQQPAYEQQTTFEYSVQSGQSEYDQSAFEQQPGQFSITTEVSYTTTDPQPAFEQQSFEPQQDQYVQQPYEQQSSFEVQQQTTFEPMPTQDSNAMEPPQQTEPLEYVQPLQQNDCPPPSVPQEPYAQPIQPAPQSVYQPDLQQTYSARQYIYDPTQTPQTVQQQVTISYQVPTYTPEPAQSFILQSQPEQPVYPVYIPNNQPEIITSDDHLVEVPGTTDNTTLVLNSGYGGNDILAGTSLAAEQNVVATQVPQEGIVSVTVQSQPPVFETTYAPEPVVVQEYTTAGKPGTIVSVDAATAENNFNTAERCNQLI